LYIKYYNGRLMMKKESHKITTLICCYLFVFLLGAFLKGHTTFNSYPDEWDELPLIPCLSVEWGGRTVNKDYVLLIKSIPGYRNLNSVENVKFTLFPPDRIELPNGSHFLIDVYDKEINDDNNFSFIDGDHDRFLSIGDRLIIKSIDHVDDDGTLSPGPGENGYFILFEDTQWGGKIFEEQLH